MMKTFRHGHWQWLLAALVIFAGAWFLTTQDSQAVDSNKTESDAALTKGAVLGKWTQDYDAALKLAKEKNLPIMLDFTGSDWCHWCKLMDGAVLDTSKWQNYAKTHVVLVKLDFPRNQDLVPKDFRKRNLKLQSQYNIQGYPTYVILAPDGKTEVGRLGASRKPTPKAFIAKMNELLRRSPAGVAKLTKDMSPALAKKYRATIADLHTVQKEEKSWMATVTRQTPAVMKKYEAYEKKIAADDAAAYKMEVDHLISKLDKDKAAAVRKLVDEEKAARKELTDWLATNPTPNTANRKKYVTMSSKVNTLHQKVQSYWK